MASSTLPLLIKNNLFRKILMLFSLLFMTLIMFSIFGHSIHYFINGNFPSLRSGEAMNSSFDNSYIGIANMEGLQNYGDTSIPESRATVEEILSKNLSSIVQVTIIKNILLDTKVGSKENLKKNDLAYYDNIRNLFDIVNDRTISSDKQILNIYKIMKEVNPGLILPDNSEK